MSSVNFHKCHGSEAYAMIAHATRHDDKDGVTYANKYIKNLEAKYPYDDSQRNYAVGADTMPKTGEIYSRLKQRIKDIDAVLPPQRIRKDRVTMMSYTIAAPDGMTDKQQRQFFAIVYDELAKFSGGFDNISAGIVHLDEIHPYRDAVTGKEVMSRAHMHIFGVPFVEGKGINGSKFETRSRMSKLNKDIDTRCIAELGVHFLTGESRGKQCTVEELQSRSLSVEQKQIIANVGKAELKLSEINTKLENKKEELDILATITPGFKPKARHSKIAKDKVVVDKTMFEKMAAVFVTWQGFTAVLQSLREKLRREEAEADIKKDKIIMQAHNEAENIIAEAKAKAHGIELSPSDMGAADDMRREHPERYYLGIYQGRDWDSQTEELNHEEHTFFECN
ncbi:MAG: plasmid recombination protein [Lachnospiraceae bacterium]|nr:plasmid recombination protein [Lachnospiraceae bacterium]